MIFKHETGIAKFPRDVGNKEKISTKITDNGTKNRLSDKLPDKQDHLENGV